MIDKLLENPQGNALGWLLEMEMVSNPMVLNSIIMNIMASIRGIKDLQLVVDSNKKQLLIFIELTKFGRWFFRRKIQEQLSDLLEQILPSFEKKVTFDRVFLERAIKIMKDK